MKLIDGKKIAEEIKTEMAAKVKSLLDKGLPSPHLAVVIVGDDGASQTYVESIKKACNEVGFLSSVYKFPENTSEEELISVIDFLSVDDEVDGIILQLPLPKHITVDKVVEHIHPDKDVDSLHPSNLGNMLLGQPCFVPATPAGTIMLLERAGIETDGKNCVVVGRSNIVGKPLSILLSQKSKNGNATVTVCHSHTENLKEICAQADILFVAIGKPEMITADYVKKDAVVFDIGVHRLPDADSEKGYRICGDVKFDEVAAKASQITPVPGGVGRMTMVALLANTLHAFEKKNL
ncbi:MAG: bifunctional 5,10-methylenetetrahydrofolate dehydrogenase/5,10-methenyltetrahydrofolate cyclohydrolase [Bacteroidales bacterium]|nr:bifunctional 5,10-methylenetetrahydrofolate dehydrogenase/5,10-methenyltetrahydrofolate cyclohydrolase [Bacteroidales bacterium]